MIGRVVFGLCILLLGACTSVRSIEGLEASSPLPSPERPSVSLPPQPSFAPRPSPDVTTENMPGTVPSHQPDVPGSGFGPVDCGARKTEDVLRWISVETVTECYPVEGDTIDELRADILRNGPSVEQADAVAVTRWGYGSTFGLTEDATGCSMMFPKVQVRVTFEYPELADPSSPARDEWEEYLRDVVIPHEERHRTIAIDGAYDFLEDLQKLAVSTAPTCDEMERRADQAAEDAKDATAAEQDAFDEAAHHP